uniref:3-oxoacyl-[acyl-carrier-protein] synthase III C-terminal domain-containing protein n=1 Tax=Congregibacter sp. TaxID=2744308 RepID=UPI003F6BFC56
TSMLCERLGIDVDKVPLTYPKLGNTGPAAVPLTLAQESESLKPGDRVLCLGMGSGINAMALEIAW